MATVTVSVNGEECKMTYKGDIDGDESLPLYKPNGRICVNNLTLREFRPRIDLPKSASEGTLAEHERLKAADDVILKVKGDGFDLEIQCDVIFENVSYSMTQTGIHSFVYDEHLVCVVPKLNFVQHKLELWRDTANGTLLFKALEMDRGYTSEV